MSWVTFIWSLTAGISLTLGAVHFLVWTRRRNEWATLVFSIAAVAAAGYAVLDMVALRIQTLSEYAELWRWALSLGILEGVLIAWFVRLYLRAGRLWLLWLFCGLRALMLVLNFVPGPNFYFREITSLNQTPLLGELIARPHGVLHPWVMLMPLSFVLIIIFAIDAARTAAKRGKGARAWVLGGLMAVGYSLAFASYALYAHGILPSTFSSQIVLLLILLMGYELSLDVLRAGQLSRDLLESQQRMRLAASAADLSLWEWDIIRDRIWVTERGRERAGVDASERIDFARFLQAIHPDDREPTERAVRRSLDGGGEFEAEYRVMDRDGAGHWVIARGQVEHDTKGRPLRLRGVAVDITGRRKAEDDRRRAELEIQQKRNELAHLSRVTTVSELSGSLAHELNQPLGIILSNAQAAQELLLQDPPVVTEVKEILTDIVAADRRAAEIIKRLRSLLKRGEVSLQPLSLNELIEEVLGLVNSDLIGRGVTVIRDLAPDLPPVIGDRIQLQQLTLNLILNAADAMAGNAPGTRRLYITTIWRNSIVLASVRDEGTGLPPDVEDLFKPFFTTKPHGLGLGLGICRSIITAHRGRLWAEPHPEGGAVFHFELPIPDTPIQP